MDKYPSGQTQGAKVAKEICETLELLDYNENEAAQIEATEVLTHDENNTSWLSLCLKKKVALEKGTARFGGRPKDHALNMERQKMKQKALKLAKERVQRHSAKLIELERNFKSCTAKVQNRDADYQAQEI